MCSPASPQSLQLQSSYKKALDRWTELQPLPDTPIEAASASLLYQLAKYDDPQTQAIRDELTEALAQSLAYAS